MFILTKCMINGKKLYNIIAKPIKKLKSTYSLFNLIFWALILLAFFKKRNLYIAYIKD